mmetsp:Transcript_24030/g.75268  ORF Transcript_24030/g.75268 Transcript_24030/m.75268 type:complete len:95 (-) Transcript_24030:612-896(-)
MHTTGMLVRPLAAALRKVPGCTPPPGSSHPHLLEPLVPPEDSLALLPALDARAVGDGTTIIDVGTGGGLPGMIIAIARPSAPPPRRASVVDHAA